MKKTMMLALAAVVGLGGITLLVGNDKDETPTPSGTNAVTATTPASSAATNEPAKESVSEPAKESVDVAKAPPAPPALSPAAEEIVQLARAHVGTEVLLAYVERSTNAYALKADEILYLNDVGVPAEVVAAMVRHGQELNAPEPTPEPVTSLAAVSPQPSIPVETPASTPPPEPAPAATEAPVASNEAQPVTNNYFYNSLSPYGTWVEVPEYGWCWQPTVAVVNPGWQPYCDNGGWLYTDAGWYWNSYYSWGWAPFHYGRWYLSPGCGWVWAPGTCWGPAWVTWRYGNGYCGWAPLPPACGFTAGIGLTWHGGAVGFGFGFGLTAGCYTFVPTSHFHSETPWVHRVPPAQLTTIYGRSTAINNYVTGTPHNPVVNVGPGTSRIAAASHTEITKVSLHDAATPNSALRGRSLSRNASSLAVYRPNLPEQSPKPPANITRRQQEIGRRSEELARSDAVSAANTQVQINRAVAPQRELPGRTLGRSQHLSEPPVSRVGSSPSPAASASRSETRRSPNAAPAPSRGSNARPEPAPPRIAPTPSTAPHSGNPGSPRAETGRVTVPGAAPSYSVGPQVDSWQRGPGTAAGSRYQANPSRSEAPRQSAQPRQGVQIRVSPPQPSAQTEPRPYPSQNPSYTWRSESPGWRVPASQPTYRAPAPQPGYAPAPHYSPPPASHYSPAPASRAPMMSSPPAPAPAPVQARPSVPSGSSSRGGFGGRER